MATTFCCTAWATSAGVVGNCLSGRRCCRNGGDCRCHACTPQNARSMTVHQGVFMLHLPSLNVPGNLHWQAQHGLTIQQTAVLAGQTTAFVPQDQVKRCAHASASQAVVKPADNHTTCEQKLLLNVTQVTGRLFGAGHLHLRCTP